jgi:predicted nucleic acid-binding protein
MENRIIQLNTDFLWEYITSNTEAIELLSSDIFDVIALSSITIAELIKGCGNKAKLKKLIKEINDFLPVHIDSEISKNAIRLIEEFHLSHNIGINDAYIAATSLYFDIELATCNISDFQYIPQLRLLEHNVKPKRKGCDSFL